MKIEIDTEIFRKQLMKVFHYYAKESDYDYEYLSRKQITNEFLLNAEKIVSDALNSEKFKKALFACLLYDICENGWLDDFFDNYNNSILESVKKKLSQQNKDSKKKKFEKEKEKEILDLKKKINKLGLSIVDNKILSKIQYNK